MLRLVPVLHILESYRAWCRVGSCPRLPAPSALEGFLAGSLCRRLFVRGTVPSTMTSSQTRPSATDAHAAVLITVGTHGVVQNLFALHELTDVVRAMNEGSGGTGRSVLRPVYRLRAERY